MTPKPTYEDLAQKVKVLEAELGKFEQKTDDKGHGITERNRLERELSHMHDLMHDVIWHSNAAIAIHDRDLNYIYVSENYLKQYKVKEKDVIGRHHYDVFPDLPQKWRDVHQRVLAGAVEGKDEDIYIRADGSVDWTRWTCRPWYESDGSIGGIIVDTEVITDRKLAEAALRESEEKYRKLVHTAPYGIQLTDLNGKIVFSNPAHHRIQGYADGELIGKFIWDLMADETHRSGAKAYYEKLVREQPAPEVYFNKDRTRDGREVDVQVNWDYVFDGKGGVEGIISVISDILIRAQNS